MYLLNVSLADLFLSLDLWAVPPSFVQPIYIELFTCIGFWQLGMSSLIEECRYLLEWSFINVTTLICLPNKKIFA